MEGRYAGTRLRAPAKKVEWTLDRHVSRDSDLGKFEVYEERAL